MTATHTPVRRGGTRALKELRSTWVGAGAALVALALLWGPTSIAGGGSTRSWWRRGGGSRADAQAARDAAAQAFYELDTAQREVKISIETISAVENSSAAQRAVADFAALSRRVDEASHAYITAVDAHDLDSEELDSGAATRALGALGKTRDELKQVKKELDRFVDSLAPLLAEAERQLSHLVPSVERARQTLLAATNALDAVRAAGLQAKHLAERLAALAPELTRLNQGAGVHGVPETLRRAEEVISRASEIREEAERLPELAKTLDRRLASLRTRIDALANRMGDVEPVLSQLRRRYAMSCWQDLQDVKGHAERAVQQARARLKEAERAREGQRWPEATALLATVRAVLDEAESGISAARKRLRSLDQAARDPQEEIDRTRFTLRDAQRLAMAGRSTPDPRHARPLDDAVARIDRAVAGLEGRHPDYWHFLTEMAAVRETASQVVAAIREEKATGH